MGMYTELIFGVELKKDTPKEVIKTLQIMIDGDIDIIKDEKIAEFSHLFRVASYYFGVSSPVNKMWFDEISQAWIISTRSNIKNYGGEIEAFLDWIKPFVDSGSGYPGFYAIVTHEESREPTIYYLDDTED